MQAAADKQQTSSVNFSRSVRRFSAACAPTPNHSQPGQQGQQRSEHMDMRQNLDEAATKAPQHKKRQTEAHLQPDYQLANVAAGCAQHSVLCARVHARKVVRVRCKTPSESAHIDRATRIAHSKR